jgi:tetratricopeptide (TPR) repeat protein
VTALALVLLLQPAAAQGAFGAARPSECGLSEGFRATNAWERAKEPNLRRYCDLLASGTAKLVGAGTRVKDVPAIADEADKLLPGRAAPSVLKGRALLRLGKAEEALAALGEARKRDERALDDPLAGLVWARANARTGHPAEAVKAYRAALPRMSSASPQERAAAAFEAGMAVMGQPSAIDDAIAMFRQARRDAQEALAGASVLALALALDRAGQSDEARAVLADVHADTAAIVADPRVALALADAGCTAEADALIAIVSGDASAWRRVADAKGAWAEHARTRAESGRKKGK